MFDESQLEALRRLEEVWKDIDQLVTECRSKKAVGSAEEKRYDRLIGEARYLYGQVSSFMGSAGMQIAGRSFDAFQHILGQGSLYGIVSDDFGLGLWHNLWSAGQSLIQQTTGKFDAQARRGDIAPSPEVIARWRWVIRLLEKARGAAMQATKPLRRLSPLVEKVEKSTLYRIAVIAGAVFTIVGIGVVVWKLLT